MGGGGGLKKIMFFCALRFAPSVWSKNSGGAEAPQAPPVDLPVLVYYSQTCNEVATLWGTASAYLPLNTGLTNQGVNLEDEDGDEAKIDIHHTNTLTSKGFYIVQIVPLRVLFIHSPKINSGFLAVFVK